MKEVIQYYDNYDENSRLIKDDFHQVEFLTTTYILNKFIAQKSKVIDVGAGTGRYAFHLSSKEHYVTALDIVPKHVELMKEKSKKNAIKLDISLGNALDLSQFNDSMFDVVLCMGPIYHLKCMNERKKALKECIRILKPDGIIAVAYINRYASHLIEIVRDNKSLDLNFLDKIIKDGIQDEVKTEPFYFSCPKEIEKLMKDLKIKKKTNVGTDGIIYLLKRRNNSLTKSEFNYLVDYHLKTCENEFLLGYSLHGLYIGQK